MARSFDRYTFKAGGIQLRPYQLEPAKAILNSIKNKLGMSFVVIISRQSGKDELAANLKAYLMTRFQDYELGIVEVNPTYKPQTINAIMRLENRLSHNLLSKLHWKKRSDFMRMVGKCTTSFLSGDVNANVVGATASLLLIVNEAQDISPAQYDKKFAPMVASTNATRIFFGTQWTSQTLLHREEKAALEAEAKDGLRRVFKYTADDVRKVVPYYGKFVDGEISKLGRNHPLIKTQYFCELIDAESGMFTAARMALMKGDLPAHSDPQAGVVYIFCIDVGGVDEAANRDPETQFMANPGRDSTALSIYAVDLSEFEIRQAPIFRIVHREAWQGQNHVVMWGKLKALNDIWQPQTLIMDATGVGEGLYSMFSRCCAHKTIPVKFTSQKKSEIGYRYLGMIETGRIRDCAPSKEAEMQYAHCQSEVTVGAQKTLKWGVPEGVRDQDGSLVHDDILLADALIAEADLMNWYLPSPTLFTTPRDVLKDMDNNF